MESKCISPEKEEKCCPLPINNTLFVDAQFGNNFTGLREDETKPFKTLAVALLRAEPGDTIYVHPGEYNENSLILKNEVNWFFSEGASIVNSTTGTSIFIINSDVTSTITGYGIFASSFEVVKHLDGIANLTIKGESFEAPNIFNLSGTSVNPSIFDIEGNNFIGTNILFHNENATVTFNFHSISVIDNIINVIGSGKITMNGNSITKNTTGSTHGFDNRSNSINIIVNCQSYIHIGNGYAINSEIVSVGEKPPIMKYEFQFLNISGGFIRSIGDFVSDDPSTQPNIIVNSHIIVINYSAPLTITTSPVYSRNSIVTINYDLMNVLLLRAYVVYDVEKSITFIKGQNVSAFGLDGKRHYYLTCHDCVFIHQVDIHILIGMSIISSPNVPGKSGGGITFVGSALICDQSVAHIPVVESINGDLNINVDDVQINHPMNAHTFITSSLIMRFNRFSSNGGGFLRDTFNIKGRLHILGHYEYKQ